ncbi:hypothetical protein [Actinokineospora bangkokensis]|uniref:hypothetical protein n=1 Tax=Actinokineospora bangkokensis TaxID=1193682 RepID=UPI00130185D9|nr:hypothetical protein [Actinokineospora bangkokensis]
MAGFSVPFAVVQWYFAVLGVAGAVGRHAGGPLLLYASLLLMLAAVTVVGVVQAFRGRTSVLAFSAAATAVVWATVAVWAVSQDERAWLLLVLPVAVPVLVGLGAVFARVGGRARDVGAGMAVGIGVTTYVQPAVFGVAAASGCRGCAFGGSTAAWVAQATAYGATAVLLVVGGVLLLRARPAGGALVVVGCALTVVIPLASLFFVLAIPLEPLIFYTLFAVPFLGVATAVAAVRRPVVAQPA